MKKRILSLVLCAAMLLSMCLFLGAGVVQDTAADAAEAEAPQTVAYTAAGPFLPAVSVQPQVLRAARAAAANGGEENALKLSKKVTANTDGTYTITMEAYTTGTVTTSTTTTPCDIVLVLDQSGSMAFDFDGNQTSTDSARRQYAMKQAVSNFIQAVAGKYDAAKSDHRISIVTFGSGAATLTGWTLVTPTKTYAEESGETKLKAEINELPEQPEGATNVGAGMQQAQALMSSAGTDYEGSNKDRQKIVVVFTDGVPTTQSDFSTTVANTAINSAKAMKDSGVTVYSVGIFNGANPGQLYGDEVTTKHFGVFPCTGEVGQLWGATDMGKNSKGNDFVSADIPAGNRFLNYLSSNFDSANIGLQRGTFDKTQVQGYDENVNRGDWDNYWWREAVEGYKITQNFQRASASYYLTANDSASLDKIFTTISQNVGSTNIDLDSKTVIRDVVTPYFTLPENTSDIHVYTADCTGAGPAFGARVEAGYVKPSIDPESRTVSVTGFDFNENYVTEKPRDPGSTYGKKLIVEFVVKRSAGFVGGNNVPTNGDTSGVYTDKGVSAGLFDVPKANVPILAPALTGADCNVYYLGTQPTPDQLCIPYDTRGNDFSFVDVTYTADRTVDMTRDGVYTATATIRPKTAAAADSAGAAAVEAAAAATATVRVYKPVVTVQDSSMNLGERADYSRNLDAAKIVWKHDATAADPENMIGEAPELTFAYSPEASAFTQDTGVKVTVRIGERDVPADVVTFRHDPCTFPGCKYTDDCGYQFYVHINTFDLTVTKSGEDIAPNQTFVFRIQGKDNDLDMQIVITGTGSKTVTGLPVGDYTVTEDTSWSWKYEPAGGATQELKSDSIQNGTAAVTFENKNKGTNWLTTLAKALNRWSVDGSTITRDPKN